MLLTLVIADYFGNIKPFDMHTYINMNLHFNFLNAIKKHSKQNLNCTHVKRQTLHTHLKVFSISHSIYFSLTSHFNCHSLMMNQASTQYDSYAHANKHTKRISKWLLVHVGN